MFFNPLTVFFMVLFFFVAGVFFIIIEINVIARAFALPLTP